MKFQELITGGLLQIGDGYRAKNEELGGAGPIFLRAAHVTDTHIDFSEVERFKDASRIPREKFARPGDTVVTTKGAGTGRVAFVTGDMPEFVYSPHLSYWRSLDHGRLVPGFLRYWSQGPEFLEQLEGMRSSTDMAPYLSLGDQRRLHIFLPPPSVQQAIASVLSVLDEKNEANSLVAIHSKTSPRRCLSRGFWTLTQYRRSAMVSAQWVFLNPLFTSSRITSKIQSWVRCPKAGTTSHCWTSLS